MKTSILILLIAISAIPTAFTQVIDWHLGGNNEAALSNAVNQAIGTNTNFPLRLETTGIQRMHINENNTFYSTVPTDGYIGIGANPTDVRSRLTITGTNNSGFGGNGFRAWMNTGVFNLENSDNMYVGLKNEGYNHSDAVIASGDDGLKIEKVFDINV